MDSNNVEVVISGITGIFPECENFDELEEKLINKENLITSDNRKWYPGELDVPSYTGKFKKNISLDNMFFRLHNKLFEVMDPTTTQSIKGSFEAICDAGINPFDLSGSNTAVIMSSFISETEYHYVNSDQSHSLVGQSRTMQSNRISFFLNFKGPSYVVDASWNGGIQALQLGHQLVASGQCYGAVVGASNMIFGPEISFLFQAMGKLNKDGNTKCFSTDADGYARSEACIFLFLQRAEDAKRSYGTILGVNVTESGERFASFTDFCPILYKQILKETYEKAYVDPSDVAYLEADGSASKIMDAMELNSVAEVMCKNRSTPLPIGCVKSNLGHSEAASSFVSIVKALIALKTGMIPPNLHYSAPNPDVPALLSGQLKVITEPTPLEGNIVAVTNFGLAGSYGHVIIRGNKKMKSSPSSSTLPWLFVISGRQEEDLEKVIKKIESMPFNEEFVRLTHDVFKTHIKGHAFKGYTILNSQTDIAQQEHEIKLYEGDKKPVWFMFSGMGSQWPRMGSDLMELPTFAKAINFCHDILLPKGIDLLHIITSPELQIYNSTLNSFVGIAAIQIGLVDILKELEIEPDGIIGHSVGELGCAYADGCFTAEQTILAAYARGRASIEVDLIRGMMAAVGKGYEQIKDELPPSIEVACHNSAKSCTLSGPAEDMEKYIEGIKEKGIFAKLVNVSNIAYHSRYIKPAAPILEKYLKQVITEPKERSKRWISSSIPETSWDSDLAKFSSAEYHTNNLLSSVLFEEASAHIPEGAIVIEIAPHGLLQSIVRSSLKKCINIALTNKYSKDNLIHLLRAIGKLYLEGISVNIDRLYPKIEFPVAASTPSITPLLTWTDKVGLGRMKYKHFEATEDIIKMSKEQTEKYFGIKIGKKQLISSTALIWNVMGIFKKISKELANKKPVLIKNIDIKKEVDISKSLKSEIHIKLQQGTGNFEIDLDSSMLMTGSMAIVEFDSKINLKEEGHVIENPLLEMNHYEIYKYVERFSVNIKDSFKLIQKISINYTDLNAKVTWNGQMVEFLDSLLMLVNLYDTLLHNEFRMIQAIRQICIDLSYFEDVQQKEIDIFYNRYTKELSCEGIKINQLQTKPCKIVASLPKLSAKTCQFLPYYTQTDEAYCGDLEECLHLVYQNSFAQYNENSAKLKIVFESDKYLNNEFLTILKTFSNNNNKKIELLIDPCEDSLDDLYLNLDKADTLLIIGELLFYKRTSKCLKKVKSGYLLLKPELNIDIWNPVYPVFKLKFNDKFLMLYKASYKSLTNKNVINMDNDNWTAELRGLLNQNALSEGQVYVYGRVKSLSRIYKIIYFTSNLKNSHLIRFIFLDSEAPEFSLQLPFYRQQIMKDLIINIYINNTWGCLQLAVPVNKSARPAMMDHQTLVYQLSSVECNDVRLTALGMNLENNELLQEPELGVYDFSGVNKAGKTVFGIGELTENHQLIDDKILTWDKPASWSHEDAATIPFCYAMAYCILKIKSGIPTHRNSLMVHNGAALISQAIIRVALSIGYKIFVTYKSAKEKSEILQIFPELEEENLFCYSGKSFEVPILTKTKGKGIDVIVNPTNNYSILIASLRCVAHAGRVFQLSTESLTNDCNIGMFVFLKGIVLSVLPSKSLLELSDSEKEILHKEVQNGINSNYVKPLQYSTIPNTALNIDAIHVIKNINNEENKKLLTRCSCHNEALTLDKDLFICSDQKNYVIINYDDTFHVDLIRWLLSRGAKNIYMLAEEELIPSISQRFICVKNNHPSAKIDLQPSNIINDKNKLKNYCNDIGGDIAEIFIVGEVMENNVINIDSAIREINSKCSLVCIGNGGESVCELRRRDGFPALAVSCSCNILKPPLIFPELDRFINNRIKSAVIFLEEDSNEKIKLGPTGTTLSYDKYPKNITELLELSKRIVPKACFVEVMTPSPNYRYNRALTPIFILPGLKPNDMETLASKIHYPTFEARLPLATSDIDSIANELYQDLKRFEFNVFTLISNDWGGALGISLAKKLEDNGKIVLLVMLNSSPHVVQNWVSEVLEMGEINLINKYVKIPYKIKKKLYLLSEWNEKLRVTMENCDLEENERERIKNGLNFLRKCLLAIKDYKPNTRKFLGKYFIYLPNEAIVEDYGTITQFCQRKPVVEVIPSVSHQEMLDEPLLATKINSLIPYEYKTAAQKIDCEIFGDYVVVGRRMLAACT